ncbi:MAG: PIN domain-containing protein [Verrucomicrobiota bacterium]
MKFLLDTNVCIAVMRGQASAVSRLKAKTPGDCVVSAVTAYELFTGIAKCREPERERTKVTRLLSAVQVLPFDEPAAQRAGNVRAELEAIGKVCGPYDLLLAGHALALGLTLITNNVREFSRVSGLVIENWVG